MDTQKILDRLNRKKVLDKAAVHEFHGSRAVRNLHVGAFQTRDGAEYETVLNKNLGHISGRRIERKWDRPGKPGKCGTCGKKHRQSLACHVVP